MFPQADKVSTVSPEDFVALSGADKVPRLFATKKSAKVILGMWLKGKATKTEKVDPIWPLANRVSVVQYEHSPDRHPDDYEVVPVTVSFNGEYERV